MIHPNLFRTACFAAALSLTGPAWAQDDAPTAVLITGAALFDGMSPDLITGQDVLIEGNTIARIAADIAPPDGARVIAADGLTLMPGLTDAHWHTMMSNLPLSVGLNSSIGYVDVIAAESIQDVLMRGFTTVRDAGGPSQGIARAIDEGIIPGPRIYPSGATISQTSGHGDFRSPWDLPDKDRATTRLEMLGYTQIADGVPELRRAAREELMKGATQLKVMAGGGVSSDHDPLDVRQYSLEELSAVVDAASAWNTYVAVHAYTPQAIRTAIEAGVKSIEHGNLMDEETAQMMAERGVWLSIQPFLDDADAIPFPEGSENRAKQVEMTTGTATAYDLAKRFGIKTAFGTDTLFSPELATRQGAQLAKLARWYEPWEVLRMATSTNHELFKLSGPRDPYPGENGVLREGAYADLLLVDGNPLQDIELVADPDANFVLIMKDGVIYKDTLQ